MKRSISIIIANAPLQSGNRGCGALTFSVLYIINKIFENSDFAVEILLPDAQIKSWSFKNIVEINRKEIKIIPIRYDAPTSLKSAIIKKIKCFIFPILGRHTLSNSNCFLKSNFILNIGQGDSFADIYGEERFNMIDRANVIAKYYKKPLCILPQTIGPFENDTISKKAVQSLEYARMVMARDNQSLKFVKELAPTSFAKEYIDVAFFLPFSTITQTKDKVHVGLNISALLWNGGYNKDNQFGLKCDYKHLIHSVIEYFLKMPEVIVHLVPHVVEPDPGIENDYEVSYNLWKEYNSDQIRIAPFALSPIDIKSYIAGLDFMMGARMHATIAAFSSGVPVVPMAYSRKFNGLFEDTLGYYHMIDMKNQTENEIMEIIKDSFFNRSKLKTEIDIQNATTVKERGVMLENDLKKFFGLC